MRNFNQTEVCFNNKREYYFKKKSSYIISKVPNLNFNPTKLLLGPRREFISYFSPDVKLAQRKINSFSPFDSHLPNTNDSSVDGKPGFFNSSCYRSKKFSSLDQKNPVRLTETNDTSQKFKHIVTIKDSRTPMQSLQNPLARNFNWESNNSQRDGLSDHSEDDLLFLDEYFKDTPTAKLHEEPLDLSKAFR